MPPLNPDSKTEPGPKDDDKNRIYYRGLSVDDLEEYIDNNGIKSHALRKGEKFANDIIDNIPKEILFERHQYDSKEYNSPFVGVTDNEYWANQFSLSGDDPSGFIAKILTNRAIYNPANVIDPCNEYLIPMKIEQWEIIGVYKYNDDINQ